MKNYAQLVDLHAHYAEKGLRILAFPCNQFGAQESGPNEEIKEFTSHLGVHFDMFDRINVNGTNELPLFTFLKKQLSGTFNDNIKWNFTKFLCNRDGVPVKRYAPMTDPFNCIEDIEKELD